MHLLDTPSLNSLVDPRLAPGDLAVTRSGIHILAYAGGQTWIEADPGVNRVISISAPANENGWFESPMRIVRWRVLAQ